MAHTAYNRRFDLSVIAAEWTVAILLLALSLSAWFVDMGQYNATDSFGALSALLTGRIVGLAILVGLPFCRPFIAIGVGLVLWTLTIAVILGFSSICSTC